MDLADVMNELAAKGSAQTKKVMARHGLPEPSFGVKVGDMKSILKKTKQDHDLALELWDTGNADAMYLAGLMADASRITKKDLQRWANSATWTMLREYSVAGVAADSPHGSELARAWIDAKSAEVRSIGWATWGGVVSVTPDADLDLAELEGLLARVEREIHAESDRVRYTMNGFVIAVGGYVAPLAKRATKAAWAIGVVEIDMLGTSCKVPDAAAYIAKIAALKRTGKKRATARCSMASPATIPLDLPAVDVALPLVVVADLHLDLADERGGYAFACWARALTGAGTLAVLGDLFDAWVGPAQERLPGAGSVLYALRALVERRTAVLVVHGNRDFLLDRSFEARTGARVLRDGFAARLADGSTAAFVHGDTLCTKDRAYQRLRRVVRSRPVAWLAPRLPLPIGTAVARRLRRASVTAVARKPAEEKSVQADAAAALARDARADLVVCGHAHEFRDERLAGGARWVVLDAFGGARDALVIGERVVVALSARDLAGRDCRTLDVP